MKRISVKSTLLSIIGIFAVVAAFSLSSCNKGKCKTVTCANGGVCQDDGSCTCPAGFEGERCETITRAKFKGVWTVTEDGTASNPAQYAVSVEDGDNIADVIIRNFYNKNNQPIFATVKGDTLIIPSQEMTVGSEVYTIRGKGYAEPEAFYGLHGKLILNYQVLSQDGTRDLFGLEGNDNPSVWTK